jgi:hypothetical protein
LPLDRARSTCDPTADDAIVEAVEAGLPFRDDLRLEAAVAVARNRNLDRTRIPDARSATLNGFLKAI